MIAATAPRTGHGSWCRRGSVPASLYATSASRPSAARSTGRAATYVSLEVTSVTPGDATMVTAHAATAFERAALGVLAPRFLIGRRIAVVIDATFAPPSHGGDS
jgi:hypothetical protein